VDGWLVGVAVWLVLGGGVVGATAVLLAATVVGGATGVVSGAAADVAGAVGLPVLQAARSAQPASVASTAPRRITCRSADRSSTAGCRP
jgi:hypothetical protein